MPAHTPLFEYNMYPFPASRYHQGSFSSASSSSSASLLPTAGGDTLTSFATRPSWSAQAVDSQHPPSEYDSPTGTPYSEYGSPFEQDQYATNVASQSVGYPESSQRTHVPEAAFGQAMYAPRFYTSADSSSVSSRSPHTPEDEHVAYRFPTSPQHTSVSHTDNAMRATHGAWHEYTNTTPSTFDRLSSQSITSYSRSLAANAQSVLASRPLTSPISAQDSQSGFSRGADRESPRLSSFAYQSRLHAAEGLGEPGNPSVVPPLVFDGEEYDDDSECSLPSAGPDMYRSSYQTSAQYHSEESVGALSASSSRDSGGELGNTTPPPDSSTSSPRMHSERAPTERPKSGQKKSKMHQCTVCQKWFPRPSGLATHMNSHSGAKRMFSVSSRADILTHSLSVDI